METLTTVPLSDFFGLFAPKFLIGTTYTASLAFFESVVLPKIDRSRLHGAVIIGDEFGFANATAEASALVDVTTTYSMVLAPHGKSFHAKVWIMATDDEFAVLCGSGNLTHSGFIGNHELFDVIRIRPGGNQRELGNELVGFVEALADLFKGFDTDTVPAREILVDCVQAMKGVAAAQSAAASREVFFLSSFGGNFPDQIVARSGAGAKKVCVAAPFFGGSFKGLDSLSARFPAAKLEVFPALHGSSIDLPRTPAGETRRKLKLWSEKGAFAHLKLYGFSGDAGAWLFNGSVNCTIQALSGGNVEAGVLRKVPQSTFAYYFKSDGPLPKVDELKIVWPESGSRWLRLWAANVGSGIRLSLDPAEVNNTPLSQVSVELLSGSQSTSVQFSKGFVQSVWLIHWEQFQKRPEGPNCLSVKITGTDSSGHLREGVAFVDDTAMLSSTPQQRNAWAGVQTILTAEAIPSLAELGAVFELLGRVMEGADEVSVPNSNSPHKPKEEPRELERAEPIWPPQPGATRGGASGWNSGSDACFQKMLEGLLRDPSLGEITEEDSADLDDGKKPSIPSERRRKAAQKVFELAKERIADFCRRVHSMTPDSVRAERLLLVAVGYFHLAQRVWTGTRKLRPDAASKELMEVVADYTKALFDRRPQGHSFTPAFNSVYRHSMFPPLAWDIQHRFQRTIHDSLVPFHIALFAFLKARGGATFSRRQWLTFRSAAQLGNLDAERKAVVIQVALRLFGEGENIEQLKIEFATALTELDGVKWCNEPGYASLLKAKQANRKIVGVDPNQRFCPNDGCPRIKSPEFDGLNAIGTVDCPRCRSVLTPFQLHEAFLLDHGS